jgi:hypothetical protein
MIVERRRPRLRWRRVFCAAGGGCGPVWKRSLLLHYRTGNNILRRLGEKSPLSYLHRHLGPVMDAVQRIAMRSGYCIAPV